MALIPDNSVKYVSVYIKTGSVCMTNSKDRRNIIVFSTMAVSLLNIGQMDHSQIIILLGAGYDSWFVLTNYEPSPCS